MKIEIENHFSNPREGMKMLFEPSVQTPKAKNYLCGVRIPNPIFTKD